MKVFIVFITLILTHVSRSVFIESTIHTAYNYISTHNDIQIKTVIVVAKDIDCLNDQKGNCIDFWKSTFLRNKLVAYIPMELDMEKLQKCLRNTKPSLVIVLGVQAEDFFEKILRSFPKSYFVDNSWLLVLDSNDVGPNDAKLRLGNLELTNQLSFNSQIYLLKGSSNVSELFEVYPSCSTQIPMLRKLIAFSTKRFHFFNGQFIWARRKDLRGCKIRMAYAAEGLFYQKYEKPYFKMLESHLNFSVNYLVDKGKSYGVFDPDTGKWSGVVGMLQRKEADISLNWMAITSPRANVMSYSIPIVTVNNKLFMKKPGSAPSWGTFVYVFSPWYWLSLISTSAIFLICIYCVSYVGLEEYHRRPFLSMVVHILKYAIIATFRAMALSDVDIEINRQNENRKSWRLMTLVICIFGMVNCLIYNGGLTAFLITQKFDTPIQELNDFHLNQEYQLLVRQGGSNEQYFRESPTLNWLWKKVTKDGTLVPNPDIAEKLIKRDSKKIFFWYFEVFRGIYESFPCEVVTTQYSYNKENWGFTFNNESEYVKLFNYYILRGKDGGMGPLFPNNPNAECKTPEEDIFRPLFFGDVFSAFIMGGIGCFVAICICIYEKIIIK